MRIAWGRGWLLVVVAALSLSVGALVPSGALGRTWTVANGNDSGSGSLRVTIAAAHSGIPSSFRPGPTTSPARRSRSARA